MLIVRVHDFFSCGALLHPVAFQSRPAAATGSAYDTLSPTPAHVARPHRPARNALAGMPDFQLKFE
jgi:hypothetical protein